MTDPTTTDSYRTARSVEDEWAHILRAHIDDDKETGTADGAPADQHIERLTRAIQSHPTLALGAPGPDQTEAITTTAIEELDFVAHGPADDEEEAAEIVDELKQALQYGLHCDLVGPVSLTTPYEVQARPDRITPDQESPADGTSVPPTADTPTQMTDEPDHTDEPNTVSDTVSDPDMTAKPQDADSGIDVDPADLNPGDNATAGGAGKAAAPAAGAAKPDDTDDAGEAAGHPAQQDLDIDVEEFLAAKTAQTMSDKEGFTDKEEEIAYTAARVVLHEYQDLLSAHLFSSLDENAREIVFESTVVNGLEELIQKRIEEQE